MLFLPVETGQITSSFINYLFCCCICICIITPTFIECSLNVFGIILEYFLVNFILYFFGAIPELNNTMTRQSPNLYLFMLFLRSLSSSFIYGHFYERGHNGPPHWDTSQKSALIRVKQPHINYK